MVPGTMCPAPAALDCSGRFDPNDLLQREATDTEGDGLDARGAEAQRPELTHALGGVRVEDGVVAAVAAGERARHGRIRRVRLTRADRVARRRATDREEAV